MSIKERCLSVASMVIIALTLVLGAVPTDARAAGLIVTVTDNPDPAASLTNVTYLVKVKNAGGMKATGALATIPLPPGTEFVTCSTLPWVKPCTLASGVVTVTIGNLVASGLLKISLVLKMPTGPMTVTLAASATATNMSGSSGQQTTTVTSSDPGGPPRGTLVVTISDTPDPAPMLGQVTYAIEVKNDSTTGASNVLVTIPLPPNTEMVKCATTPKKPCSLAAGTVTATLGSVAAHATIKISLVVIMPEPSVPGTSTITLHASANGDGVTDGTATETTTILPATARVLFQPSGTPGTLNCGGTLTAAAFPGADTRVQFTEGLGCASSGTALIVRASGKTIDLAGFKIIGGSLASNAGNVGIFVNNASNVTILGGGTTGIHGLEYFDYGVRSDAGSDGLSVDSLRIFRARSAGLEVASNGVTISDVLIDRTVPVVGATVGQPAGVGIHASGNAVISDTIVRRSGAIGILADGTHQDASGFVVTITGNLANMQVEQNAGVGIQFDNGPHRVVFTSVIGDGISGTSTDGVVVGPTATGILLDSVVVKEHGGDGFVIDGASVRIVSSSVDTTVGGDSFVISGAAAILENNDAQSLGNGYMINGASSTLTSNSAETGKDGFVINADGASVTNNNAVGNKSRGIVVAGNAGLFDTNLAQFNGTHGMVILGSNHRFINNQSKGNKNSGFSVSGTQNSFGTNAAELNSGTEWIIGANNLDEGGNSRNGSRFTFTSAGGNFN